MGILDGVRLIEIAGLGPGPFCGMLFADLGADVITIERPSTSGVVARPEFIVNRGKRSISLDLKRPESVEIVLRLVERADALIEGMRPGVMERLGLSPEICLARHPQLVYGRMTGWGQTGPLAGAAGHDGNYIALSGALWYASPPGAAPISPPTLIGDVAGGALYLAVGLLAGIMKARATGSGQVVDAAIVDGSAHMMNLLLGVVAQEKTGFQRGAPAFDGAHWINSYRCADGHWISLCALEPHFYAELLARIGCDADPRFAVQADPVQWPAQRDALAQVFASKTRGEWCALLEGTDACFAPINDPGEAALHPHMKAREVYQTVNGTLQAAPAPRFSEGEASDWQRGVPAVGEHTESILHEIGYPSDAIEELRRAQTIPARRCR